MEKIRAKSGPTTATPTVDGAGEAATGGRRKQELLAIYGVAEDGLEALADAARAGRRQASDGPAGLGEDGAVLRRRRHTELQPPPEPVQYHRTPEALRIPSAGWRIRMGSGATGDGLLTSAARVAELTGWTLVEEPARGEETGEPCSPTGEAPAELFSWCEQAQAFTRPPGGHAALGTWTHRFLRAAAEAPRVPGPVSLAGPDWSDGESECCDDEEEATARRWPERDLVEPDVVPAGTAETEEAALERRRAGDALEEAAALRPAGAA
jgi:hypothetical protein